MATRASRPARRTTATGRDPAVGSWVASRRHYLDNLKVILVAAVIVGHAVAGYADADFWPYAEMNEVTLSPVTQTLLYAVVAPATLVLVPTLFLVAGLLTPGSMDRKGAGRFARDRLVRLGLPFALYVLLLQPLFMYPVHPPGETQASYWDEFIGGGDQTLDTGPLWFVGVLLLFSLGYAGWVRLSRGQPSRRGTPRRDDIRAGRLGALTVAVVATTYLIRLAVPFGGSNPGISLNAWEWPACLAVFVIGIAGSRRGWLTAVPDRLARQCRTATVVSLVGFALFVAVAGPLGVVEDDLWGGPSWPPLVFATLECTLAVWAPIWLLGVAQRRLDRSFTWSRPAVIRSAYGAFVLQVVFLIGLAMALRPLPAPAEVKALLVATGSVAGCFGLAWLLISRVPGMSRIF